MQNEGQQESSQTATGWVFNPGAAPQPASSATSAQAPENTFATSSQESIVAWTASEYVGNPKNMDWYAMLGGATLSLLVIVYFLTKDIVSCVVIIILGIVVGVFAARQPQVLDYALDKSGIHRGIQFYPYGIFKTFSVVQEGAFSHVTLLPLKRFAPPVTIHYLPADEDKIIKTLADYLPYEEHKNDAIENFSRRVRF